MNLRYKAKCKKRYEDVKKVKYVYSCEAIKEYSLDEEEPATFNGEFSIDMDCLHLGEIRTKVVLTAQGNKELIQTRVAQPPKIEKHIADKNIIITKICENDFYKPTSPQVPHLAKSLLKEIFIHFAQKGELPDVVEFAQ